MSAPARLTPASDASILVELGDQVGLATSSRVHALLRRVLSDAPAWLVDAHPAYTSLLVEFDLALVDHDEVARWLATLADRDEDEPLVHHRTVEVPVSYGGVDGPDLDAVADHAGLTRDEVIRSHAGAEYTVAFLGFMPGFAYLLGVPAALRTPRMPAPRARVPAGSVAIADGQTAIYPSDSPGGWRIIGRTTRVLDEGWVAPGDRVRFVPLAQGTAARS